MKNIFIENGIESFEDLHDKEWIESVISIIDGTELEKVTEEFLAHWWGTSRAFLLPLLLVEGVHSVVAEKSPGAVPSKDDLWKEYLKINAFKGALWKTAENAYCSIYYAYENLIVGVLSEIEKMNIRINDGNFSSMFISVFDESLLGRVWTPPKLVTAKEVRNSIVHNGGKITPKLSKMQKRPQIENGDVLISASDARDLFKFLKPLVNEFLVAAVEKNAANKKLNPTK